MGTIVIGSSANKKGITVEPFEVFFNGNVVGSIVSDQTEIWSSAKPLVPAMTSNTCEVGEAFASSLYNSARAAYMAFSTEGSTAYLSQAGATNSYVGFKFDTITKLNSFEFKVVIRSTEYATTYKLQASNDNSNWVDLTNAAVLPSAQEWVKVTLDNAEVYSMYRIFFTNGLIPTSNTGTGHYSTINSLQFYGKQLYALVPTMTSNTEPYGEASANMCINNDTQAWKAFDGDSTTSWMSSELPSYPASISYSFPKETVVKLLAFKATNHDRLVKGCKLEASNDGSIWSDLTGEITVANSTSDIFVAVSNNKAYKHYKFTVLSSYANYGVGLSYLQFYGDKPLFKSLIPTMTSNTTPSGVASASSIHNTDYDVWKAFDGNNATFWNSKANSSDNWICYEFGSKKTLNAIEFVRLADGVNMLTNLTADIQVLTNDNSWETVQSLSISKEYHGIINLNNCISKSIRILQTSGSSGMSVKTIQVYV